MRPRIPRRFVWLQLLFLFCATCSLAQTAPRPAPRAALEFPLELRHKIVAGQTAVGASAEGTLVIPTLVHGVVIPEGAVFTGTVEESVPRDGDKPSRLRVHITAAKWHGKAAVIDAYLINVLYPRRKSQRDDSDDPATAAMRRRELIIAAERNGGVPPMQDTESPAVGNRFARRTTIEDVKIERDEKGVIALTSDKFNVHLDSGIVYSFEGTAGR